MSGTPSQLQRSTSCPRDPIPSVAVPSHFPILGRQNHTMRVLGIDFGERRIGLALSDPTGTLASPLPTLKRRVGKRPPLAALAELVAAREVEAVVMGLPLTLQGEDSDWTRTVRDVGQSLSGRTGVPVHFIDERFTSVVAERMVRTSGLPRRKRESKERVDAEAAVLILQSWLDGQRRHDSRGAD